MYDVLTTTFWPWMSAELPMRIGGVTGAKDVEPRIRDRTLMLVDSANAKIDPIYDSASMTDDPTGMLSGLMPPANKDRRL